MRIYVDADACPVTRIVEDIAEKYMVPCTLLCDVNHVLRSDYSEVKIVDQGRDSVDFALIALLKEGDLCVTQDYGVASLALTKKAYAIHQSGKRYTEENIDELLERRFLTQKARRSKSKVHLKGPAKRTPEDDKRFADAFERLLRDTLHVKDCITTYTGIRFDPLYPDMELFRIEDIAHALSLICRGNGHVKTFYSVGQHCIACAREAEQRGYSNRVILAALLHDASECYMSDVPSPFKRHLSEYIKSEERMLDLIYTRYLGSTLTPDEFERVNSIDKTMLYYDLKELLNDTMPGEAPDVKVEPDHRVRAFDEVEREYLEIFYKYEQMF